ncbi:glycosyltransferase family 39 protein [Tenggerimyces flavus]|uniref:Glycosyltransferase family 39 protein n=1 Tax=Tenggerimyces flavus TaxID=1708749 RepID=A0ABV7YB61_9ACTN|nr:glycosyltransferase family 39 protein [Tenggerimyces flavus]MBM7788832.1 mannosyltransferase [Tenggerimyces flavus]
MRIRGDTAWPVLVPAVLACALFCWRLGTPALWLDEAATAQDAGRPLGDLLAFLTERDLGLGAYYVGMHVWTLLGSAEWWLRLPSVLAMTVATAFVADVARRSWGTRAAYVAGLVFALAPIASRYAQEARPYALAIALAVVAWWLLHRALEDGGRRWWIGYTIVVACLGVVQLLGLLILVAHLVRARDELRPWVRATAAALIAPAILAVFTFGQRDTVAWIPKPTFASLAEAYAELAGGPWLLAALAATAVLALAMSASTQTVGTAVWFAAPPLILAGIGLLTPLFLGRYLVVCVPALALLAGAAIAKLPSWTAVVPVGLAAALAASQLQAMREVDGHGPDVRQAAHTIEQGCQPGDGIQRTVTTIQTIPYYLRDAKCRPADLTGPLPNDINRLWILQPTWENGAPSGSQGLDLVQETTVEGLRVTLWKRP